MGSVAAVVVFTVYQLVAERKLARSRIPLNGVARAQVLA